MVYSVAISSAGQLTIPKELREFLGIGGARRVRLAKHRNSVTIERGRNKEDFYKKLQVSEESREIARHDGDKSVSKILDEYYDSPAGRKELEEEYGRLA